VTDTDIPALLGISVVFSVILIPLPSFTVDAAAGAYEGVIVGATYASELDFFTTYPLELNDVNNGI
jgi:hypothetical protein